MEVRGLATGFILAPVANCGGAIFSYLFAEATNIGKENEKLCALLKVIGAMSGGIALICPLDDTPFSRGVKVATLVTTVILSAYAAETKPNEFKTRGWVYITTGLGIGLFGKRLFGEVVGLIFGGSSTLVTKAVVELLIKKYK